MPSGRSEHGGQLGLEVSAGHRLVRRRRAGSLQLERPIAWHFACASSLRIPLLRTRRPLSPRPGAEERRTRGSRLEVLEPERGGFSLGRGQNWNLRLPQPRT